MNLMNNMGIPLRATVSAVSTLGAGNPSQLLGIIVPSILTAHVVNLWTQTAGSITGQLVVSTLVLASNTYTPINAYFNKGITYAVTNEQVNLTLLWNPAD